MRHFYALILSIVFALTFVGCGANNASSLPEEEILVPSDSDTTYAGSSAPPPQALEPVEKRSAVPEVTEHSVTAIQARGTLVVAVVEENPPYTFWNDDASREGLDNALANTLADELGVGLELFSGTPEQVADAVRTGRADVALGGFIAGDTTLNRTLETAYYAGGAQVLLCCVEDVRAFPSLASFQTKSIAYLESIPAQKDILKELIVDCAPVDVSSIERGLNKVRGGTCAALILDEFQGIAYAQDTADLALATPKLTSETLVDPKVMAVMQNNEVLANFINESVIKKYTKTGGLGRLMLSATTKANNLGLLDE